MFTCPQFVFKGGQFLFHVIYINFSIAAITNHHKLSGFKNHKFISLHFCRTEVQVGQQAGFLLEAIVKDVSLPLSTSRGHLHSLTCGLFLHLQRQLHSIFQSLSSTVSLLPCSFPYKDLCDYIGPIQIIQVNFPFSNALTLVLSTKFLLACKLKHSQILGIRTWA